MDAVVRVHLKPKVFLCAPVHSERDFWSDQRWLSALIRGQPQPFNQTGTASSDWKIKALQATSCA